MAGVTAPAAAVPSSSSVVARTEGALGHLTLDRPKALNALDLGMIRELASALAAWRDDTDVQIVLLDGAGDRGLCAGGDVRALYDMIKEERVDETVAFFREEYALDATIAEFPKPFVAIADGITMGGGIGLAGHAAIRIVTERSRLAMPETRIGFTPDVGGTWLLGRAPGRLGEYLALTGGSMDAADALYAGFADHFVPSDRLDALREALAHRADPTGPSEIVLLFDETPEPSALASKRAWIDDAFAGDSVIEIVARLRASGVPEAIATADELEALSPTALAVALEAVREARAMGGLRDALAGEYRRVLWFAEHHPDLVEGIRAQLVDKDRTPRWAPSSLAELSPDAAAAARTYVPPAPLWG